MDDSAQRSPEFEARKAKFQAIMQRKLAERRGVQTQQQQANRLERQWLVAVARLALVAVARLALLAGWGISTGVAGVAGGVSGLAAEHMPPLDALVLGGALSGMLLLLADKGLAWALRKEGE